jgi:hypothetical protein
MSKRYYRNKCLKIEIASDIYLNRAEIIEKINWRMSVGERKVSQ